MSALRVAFRLHLVYNDWMHTMHLGMLQYMFGSVLWLLTHDLLADEPEVSMRQVMAELRACWRANPTPGHYQGITLKMFKTTDVGEDKYPVLKGQACEIKHLTKGLLHVFKANLLASKTWTSEKMFCYPLASHEDSMNTPCRVACAQKPASAAP